MKTTTTYTERKTITTDDAGNVTITTSHDARTVSECRFTELSEAAQARAIRDAIEEEREDYYSGNPCQMYFTSRDIIDAAHDLEKSQPIEITRDYGCSWYGTARGSYWHHAADWQSVTEQQDTGICFSMDMCDRWNEYAARIIALQEAHEEATDASYEHDEAADAAHDVYYYADVSDADREKARETYEQERAAAAFYEDIAERIEDAAEELTEDAARAVGNVVDGLIEAERDYYQSAEFWAEWLADGDDRFTRNGERI